MKKSSLFALCGAFFLCGCWAHSFPTADRFVRPVEQPASAAETVQVFADANGTFYPSGWKAYLGDPPRLRGDSLLNASVGNATFRAHIEKDEARQLAELAELGRSKDRIFILVHGYNNKVDEAEEPFRLIESRIDARPRDGLVRFFWDGLTGTGIGPGKIWFNAAGYSQLVGSRALRRVLNQFTGKTIYIIGHSRGTSVILSALSNPVYDPIFLDQTARVARSWGPAYTSLLAPPPLVDRGNRIHVIVMAPAVDRIDFCDASQQPMAKGRFACARLKDLGPQLKSFRYTVNPKDPVLNKYAGVSGGFNPTGLGTNPMVGAALSQTYPLLQAYPFAEPIKFHSFAQYVAHPTFERMLSDAGIARR